MKSKTKDKILTALYFLGAVILGALGVFILWAALWIGYYAGLTM